MRFAPNIFEKPIPSLQPRVPEASEKKFPSREFDVEAAKRSFNRTDSWESLEKALKYLVYVPMSNGERVKADEWIRRIDRVRHGEFPNLITNTGALRDTVERLIREIGR